jgi:hypothetical protein
MRRSRLARATGIYSDSHTRRWLSEETIISSKLLLLQVLFFSLQRLTNAEAIVACGARRARGTKK